MKHVTQNGYRVIRVFDWCYQLRAHRSPDDGNRCVHSCRPTKCWLRPSGEPATYDPRSAFWNLDSLFVIKYAAHRIYSEFKITKGVIYESLTPDNNLRRCPFCPGAMHVGGWKKSLGPKCIVVSKLSLQSLPTRHSPAQFEFRDIKGAGGGGFPREPGTDTVAKHETSDSDRSTANPSEHRN